ncbi:hypothetical protein PM082_010215 [Marasmius tenuissimus]|nr:hypothetical protein PM082_010215 [Marasmius tenuissimus]
MILTLLQSWFTSSPLLKNSGSPGPPEHSETPHEPPDNRPLHSIDAAWPSTSTELPRLSSPTTMELLQSWITGSPSSPGPQSETRDEFPGNRPSSTGTKDGPECSVREHNEDSGDDRTRNLVICIDGTSNKFSSRNTNVVELYSRLRKDKSQLTYYDSGIGTYPVPDHKGMKYCFGVIGHRLDLMFAFRFQRIILKAYTWLSEYYRPNDRIYLIGFSRGAYQARVLSAMIEKVGLIHKGNEGQIPFAYELYYRSRQKSGALSQLTSGHLHLETSSNMNLPHLDSPKRLGAERGAEEPALRFKRTFCRNVKVHFVGAWDTVSSVGVVRNECLPMTVEGMLHVCYFRHALALDERRVKFLPDYACGGGSPISDSEKNSSMPHTKEVWFVGTHSDIGGGNVDNAALNNNRPALRWMSQEAENAGLRIVDLFVGSSTDDPTMKDGTKIKESLKGLWKSLEYFPLKRLAYGSESAQVTGVERSYAEDNKTTRWPHRGRRRPILHGQYIHQSVYSAKKGRYATRHLPPRYRDSSTHEYVEPDPTPTNAYQFLTYFQNLTLLHHERVYKSITVSEHPQPDKAAIQNELDAVMEKFKRMATQKEGKLQFQDLIGILYKFPKVDSLSQQCDVTGAMDALIHAGANLFKKNAPRRLPPVLGDMMRRPRTNDDLKDFAREFLSTFGTGEIFTLPQTGPVGVSISANGNRLVYLARDSGKVAVVDTNPPDELDPDKLDPELRRTLDEFSGARQCVAISPSGYLVAVGFNDLSEGKAWVIVWNLENSETVRKESHKRNQIVDIRFSSDNARVYYSTSAPSKHTIWSWSVPMNKSGPHDEMKAFHGADGLITGFSVSQDSRKLVASSVEGKVHVWNLESGKIILQSEDKYRVRAVTFPTSHCFYTGSDDGTILRWTCQSDETFSEPKKLVKTDSSINVLAGGYCDDRIACGHNDALGTVEIFDVSADPIKRVGQKMYHHSAVYSLSYAKGVQPEGERRSCIVAGTRYRGGVTLWDEKGSCGERLLAHVTTKGFFFSE